MPNHDLSVETAYLFCTGMGIPFPWAPPPLHPRMLARFNLRFEFKEPEETDNVHS